MPHEPGHRRKDFPTKQFLKTLGAVGGATLLGGVAGGMLPRAMSSMPGASERWRALPRERRIRYAQYGAGAAGTAASLAAIGRHLAAAEHIDEHREKNRKKRKQGEKVASVIVAYQAALARSLNE